MERDEALKRISEALNRRRHAIEALRLLVRDGDLETAHAMSVRLRDDLDGVVRRLQALTNASPEDIDRILAEYDMLARSRQVGFLGDPQQPSGFEKWIEDSLNTAWEVLRKPSLALKLLIAHRKKVIFAVALVVTLLTARSAYERVFLANNGLIGEYYAGESFDTLFTKRQDRRINFRWLRRPPMDNFRAEKFSIRWTGFIHAERGGEYEFYTVSDDGVRLSVNDRLLIENWGIHGATLDKGVITLEPGYHPVVIEYYQGEGDSVIKLQWKRPGDSERRAVPSKYLFPRNPDA